MPTKNHILRFHVSHVGFGIACILLTACSSTSNETVDPPGSDDAGAEDVAVTDQTPPDGSTGPCIPKTCVTIGVLGGGTPCGKPWDGCGNYIDCGECGPGEVCGEPESEHPYVCVPSGDGGVSSGDGGDGGDDADDDVVDGGGAGDGGADGGVSTDGGHGGDPVCVPEKHAAELVPLDMYVLLDASSSMTGTRWAAATTALKSFVDSEASKGIGLGIQYFPQPRKVSVLPPPASCTRDADCEPYYGACIPVFDRCEGELDPDGDSCNPVDYELPHVPIQLLPMAANLIELSLDSRAPSGGTPLYPALEGAYAYATAWAQAHPNHRTAVVLALEGEPTGCGSANNWTNIAALTTTAFASTPPVRTYIIGIGNAFTTDLDAIALAGGTEQAAFVDGDSSDEFLDAFQAIRRSVQCEYQIPAHASDEEPNYDRINVTITHEGTTVTIGRVGGPWECEPAAGGWYYDDPLEPHKIQLCKANCQLVQSGSQMSPVSVDVLLGCKTKIW